MRILAFVWLGCVVACADQPSTSDILQVTAQETQLNVGNTTVMEAQLVDPMTQATMTVQVSWSTDVNGVVMLADQGEVEQVTAVGSGQVVVTANGFQQTAKVGFTVTP
jgi:PBP1b-binding outer membrane lipoprotein LpoB